MQLRIPNLLPIIFHFCLALSFLVKNIDFLNSAIVILGTVCFFLFFLKNRPVRFLSSNYQYLTKWFYLIQGIFVLTVFYVESTWVSVLCWCGLFFLEIIRRNIGGRFFHLEDSIEKLEKERDQYNHAFREIRAQRHDFLKHVSVTQHLLEEQKVEDALRYFNELIGEYKQVNASIKGEDGHIAAILFQYQKLCNDSGIPFTCDFEVPLSSLPMKKTDQSKLISNLLENSFEAADEYRKQKGVARIEMRSGLYGGIFILELKNSTLPLPNELSDHLFNEFEYSTKTGHHEGLGTFIIASLVKQYHGDLSYKYMGNELSVKIKLPIITNREEH